MSTHVPVKMTKAGPPYRPLILLLSAAAVFVVVAHGLAKLIAMETSYEV